MSLYLVMVVEIIYISLVLLDTIYLYPTIYPIRCLTIYLSIRYPTCIVITRAIMNLYLVMVIEINYISLVLLDTIYAYPTIYPTRCPTIYPIRCPTIYLSIRYPTCIVIARAIMNLYLMMVVERIYVSIFSR